MLSLLFADHRGVQRLCCRVLWPLLICVLGTATAQATQPPPCAPPDMVVLDQATADTLIEASEFMGRYRLRFAGATPQLQTLTTDSLLFMPPTAALITGTQGPVLAIDFGPAETTVTLARTERWSNPSGTSGLNFIVGPSPGDRLCEDVGTPLDTDQDGSFDAGSASGQCAGDKGGEYGFELELVDGVTINGIIAAAPFDLLTEADFENGQLLDAKFVSTGRVSFSGELSAASDAALPERPVRIGMFEVATHIVEVPFLGTVTVTIDAEAFVGACGNVTAGARLGVTSTGIADIGIEVESGEPARVLATFSDSTIDASPPQLANDAPVDVTLYGGAVLRTTMRLSAGGVLPFAGANVKLVARGSVRTQVDPNADPWWQISGRPEVYIDLSPELLTADLTDYIFDVITPPATTFFTSTDEFPFPLPAASRATHSGSRESGTALRWSRAFLSEEDFSTVDVAPASDGGALLVARSTASGALIRTDYLGERSWQRRIEGGYTVQEARQLPDGSFLVTGVQGSDLWFARVSDSGDLIWDRRLALTDQNIQSVRITKTANGQVTLGGELVDQSNAGDLAPWAANISANGNVNWIKRYGQASVPEQIFGVTGLSDGGLLLVGESSEPLPGPTLANDNAYTLRLAADGSVLWSHVWASSTIDSLYAAAQAPDGSYIVGGQTGGGNTQNAAPRALLMRFDSDASGPPLQARWIRAFGGSLIAFDMVHDQIKGIANAKDGFIVTGTSGLGANRKGWLARFVERARRIDPVWSYFYDGTGDDDLFALTNVGDGVLIGGTSRSFPDGNLDNALWLARAPLNGFLGFNEASAALAQPTSLVLAEPPQFPSFLDPSNITAEAMTTALEQETDLEFVISDAALLTLGPIGFAPAELVREPLPFLDSDGDGVRDEFDNCTLAPNADQRDSNADGFGNVCDTDLNNDGITNAQDLGLFRSVFFTPDADADFNGDGIVNASDLGTLRQQFFAAPGPSGLVP